MKEALSPLPTLYARTASATESAFDFGKEDTGPAGPVAPEEPSPLTAASSAEAPLGPARPAADELVKSFAQLAGAGFGVGLATVLASEAGSAAMDTGEPEVSAACPAPVAGFSALDGLGFCLGTAGTRGTAGWVRAPDFVNVWLVAVSARGRWLGVLGEAGPGFSEGTACVGVASCATGSDAWVVGVLAAAAAAAAA